MEDSDFLQDILECSVCLNSLTEHNKVLPCQHTFCVKCLSEILQTQNELRCPECRILYKEITNLDELPSNILLIRLLEGLKQNMRIKNNRLIKTPNQTPMKQFGKLSIANQQSNSLVQRQLMANKSVLKQLHSGSVAPLVQQYVSSRQLLTASYNGPSTNGHSIVYGNVPQISISQQQQYSNQQQSTVNRRSQLNLDNTLVKQPLDESNLQTAPKTMKTPTSSITPNLPSTSMISQNNVNNSSPATINNNYLHQQTTNHSKVIMSNARALRDSDQLGNWTIKKNDILFIKEQLNAYWYLALFNGIQGVIPISFVELISNNGNQTNTKTHPYSTLPSSMNSVAYQSMCRALYDFRVADVNDKNCLSFKKNDIITLIRRVDENWLEGMLDNNIGIFPINFVEFLPTVRPVARSSSQNSGSSTQSNCQSSVMPTLPNYNRTQSSSSGVNGGRLMNLSHSRSNSINNTNGDVTHIRSNSISILNGNSTNTQVSNGINSNIAGKQNSSIHHRCSSNTNDMMTNPKMTLHNNQIDQSPFGNIDTTISTINNPITGSSSSNSYDNLLNIKSNQSQPNLYIALYNYQPQKKDELQLKKNELYIVHETFLDGWYKGSSMKTNEIGLFPSNYLLPARNNTNYNGQSSSYQNVAANRRSFGNLSCTKFDSVDNLLGTTTTNGTTNIQLTKPKQLTNSIDDNLSDLNNTVTKMTLNAKSENYLDEDRQSQNQQYTISKSVEQLNADHLTYENLMDNKNNHKKIDSNNSSTSNSPQWIQPKVAATRSASKQKNLHFKQTSQIESPYS